MPPIQLTPANIENGHALLDAVAHFVARHNGAPVEIDVDTVADGKVDVTGYFGQTWTHGGYAPVTRKRVAIAELTDKEVVTK